ncbi:MAG: hypothetical protein J0I42_13725 [Bosea sp.]|uniref:hypothetical protein n=1 Tax=Bosea sp. (in: a-proteobacteria) TaxID=1871050 RepID=UPI001AD068DF|nr:hypothetical protein [Bosea sp. (in: a-proteobacteria)]MBN9453003.1 hypothetical protein [Bosea sp. (in: a-proteobacteria)]
MNDGRRRFLIAGLILAVAMLVAGAAHARSVVAEAGIVRAVRAGSGTDTVRAAQRSD